MRLMIFGWVIVYLLAAAFIGLRYAVRFRPDFEPDRAVLTADNADELVVVGNISTTNQALYYFTDTAALSISGGVVRHFDMSTGRLTQSYVLDDDCDGLFNFTSCWSPALVTMSADQRYMAAIGYESWTYSSAANIRGQIWEIETGDSVGELMFPQAAWISSMIAFYPDANTLLYDNPPNGLFRYDVATQQSTILDRDNPTQLVYVGRAGVYYVAQNQLKVVDSTWQPTTLFQVSAPFNIAVSPDERYIVHEQLHNILEVRDIETGETTKLIGHQQEVDTILFTANSQILITADMTGEIRRWDIGSGELIDLLHRGDLQGGWSLALSNDEDVLIAQRIRQVIAIDLETGELLVRHRFNYLPDGLAISPAGDLIIAGDGVILGVRQ